jgi:nucleoside diphosphate kinase
MIFFTLAGNVMHTYVMPGLPAFALLCAELLSAKKQEEQTASNGSRFWQPLIALILPILVLIMVLTVGPTFASKRSHAALVKQYQSLRPNAASKLVYLCQKPHSAEFYNSGKTEDANPNTVEKYFHNDTQDFFVLKDSDFEIGEYKPAIDRMERVWKFGEYNLMREKVK